ncbi:unannotated protein [freshwater metagenome]|uniref:Unannotated protein n=1 Tax=freshwater metagenome TaxID=449393 RepID=A0A6J6IYK2_9ZZZZ|nr:hypothetical protein [Actinomycetota bacterium]
MKKIVWFMAGIALGAVAARQIEENPAARKVYDNAKLTVRDFKDSVLEGYQEREAEIVKPRPKPAAGEKSEPKAKPSGK